MRKRKGPEQLCAQDEGARAAICGRLRFFTTTFYRNITFLTFLKKVRNVRNVMLRVSVVVKK